VRLTPGEQDRLTIFAAAELARRRRARGLRLNHPEAVALICDEVHERARDGADYDDVVQHGRSLLGRDEVMEGIPEMVTLVQLEVRFADGTKLVSLRDPIR
jgi:urease subunit gamma